MLRVVEIADVHARLTVAVSLALLHGSGALTRQVSLHRGRRLELDLSAAIRTGRRTGRRFSLRRRGDECARHNEPGDGRDQLLHGSPQSNRTHLSDKRCEQYSALPKVTSMPILVNSVCFVFRGCLFPLGLAFVL